MICPSCGYANLPGEDDCVNCGVNLSSIPPERSESDGASLERHLTTHRLGEIRFSAAAVLDESATVGQAVQAMVQAGAGSTLVRCREGTVAIFTERDLITRMDVFAGDWSDRKLSEFMTRDPVRLSPEDSLAVALHKMSVGHFRHLPLVDANGRPMGVLSVRDILGSVVETVK